MGKDALAPDLHRTERGGMAFLPTGCQQRLLLTVLPQQSAQGRSAPQAAPARLQGAIDGAPCFAGRLMDCPGPAPGPPARALVVRIGPFQDPRDRQGLQVAPVAYSATLGEQLHQRAAAGKTSPATNQSVIDSRPSLAPGALDRPRLAIGPPARSSMMAVDPIQDLLDSQRRQTGDVSHFPLFGEQLREREPSPKPAVSAIEGPVHTVPCLAAGALNEARGGMGPLAAAAMISVGPRQDLFDRQLRQRAWAARATILHEKPGQRSAAGQSPIPGLQSQVDGSPRRGEVLRHAPTTLIRPFARSLAMGIRPHQDLVDGQEGAPSRAAFLASATSHCTSRMAVALAGLEHGCSLHHVVPLPSRKGSQSGSIQCGSFSKPGSWHASVPRWDLQPVKLRCVTLGVAVGLLPTRRGGLPTSSRMWPTHCRPGCCSRFAQPSQSKPSRRTCPKRRH